MSKKSGTIRTSYKRYDLEHGDLVASGWQDLQGIRMSPAQVVRYLALHPDTSADASTFRKGVTYTTPLMREYGGSNQEVAFTYHLSGYTPGQQRAIFNALKAGRYVPARARRRSRARHSR